MTVEIIIIMIVVFILFCITTITLILIDQKSNYKLKLDKYVKISFGFTIVSAVITLILILSTLINTL